MVKCIPAHREHDQEEKQALLSSQDDCLASIGIDVAIYNGRVFVGREMDVFMNNRLLEEYYLEPIAELFDERKCTLRCMILRYASDEPEKAYVAIELLLRRYKSLYPRLFKVFGANGKVVNDGLITVVMSGVTPSVEYLLRKHVWIVGYETMNKKTLTNMVWTVYPLISLRYSDRMFDDLPWIVTLAHRDGRLVRVMDNPHSRVVWDELLLNFHVDFVDCDPLVKIKEYVHSEIVYPY